MPNFCRPNRHASLALLRNRARTHDAPLLRIIAAAVALLTAWPATVYADPDPCTGVGTVTCSGNQSAGVVNPPPGTTVLNVNSLTSAIAPTSGQPGILFFGTGNLTLNSATGPFGIIQTADFTDAIVVVSDGAVNVTSSGNISVQGLFANGINTLSFNGGDVGVTSSSNISLANGGDGILGVTDGSVTVASSGPISVTGDGTGISASGGLNVSVTSSGGISVTGDGDAIDAFDTSGPAGGGGVTVTSSGAISVAGDSAIGINVSSDDTDEVSVKSSSNISVANGGSGIVAFGLGPVAVSSSGEISVLGSSGVGIAAASGGAGTVDVTASGGISIAGDGAAIIAVSVGGAAGVTSTANIVVGGDGVGITAIGVTGTTVSSSGGISIGGGGSAIDAISVTGDADVTSSGRVSIKGDGAAIAALSAAGAANVTSSGNISVGGNGGGITADGNTAEVTSSGSIAVATGAGITATGTNGAAVNSSGIIAIGGNGDAIDAVSAAGAANVNSSGNISIGGAGSGISAQGNTAEVTSSGNIAVATGIGITATGANGAIVNSSAGISVGGQSGVGIMAAGSNAVAVNSSGNIALLGAGSTGIAAFSRPASSQGAGVGVVSSGNITTTGPGSTAIMALATAGNIAVKITGGTITGGSGAGAGIALVGGGNNTLANAGVITTAAGLAGTAILGMPISSSPSAPPAVVGSNTVSNAGTVIGNVNLGPGRNAFNNLPGGTFNSGASVALGAGNPLNNNGNLSPGGSGVIQTTALTGNLVQGGLGKISVDVNPATGQADRINASGSANLAGRIVVNLTNTTPSVGATAATLVHAQGGAVDDGLVLGPLPAVAAYQLEFPDANDVVLEGGLNFAPSGLNGNQTAIGQNINAIQLAGGSPSFLPVAQAILTIPDRPSLQQAYNQLSPETYTDNEIGDFYSGLRFASNLMSCEVPDGRYVFIKEGQCVWAQVGGKFLDLNANSASLGFSENAFVMAGGAEVMLRPDWFAGFALGYDHGNINTGDTLAQSQANRAHFGASIKYNPGPFLFAAAVYGGYGWYTTDRFINFADFSATASSDSTISRVGGQFRAAYLIDRGAWYLKPVVDLNVTRVNLNSFSEQGAGGADLIVPGTGSTVFSASPAVEVGTQTGLQNGALLRPFARLGVTAFSNTDFAVSAAFSGAPAGVAPFRVATGIDAVTGDFAAGADLFLPESRWALKLAYSGHYGARVRDQGIRLKASLRF